MKQPIVLMPSPLERYQAHLDKGEFQADSHQQYAVQHIQSIYQQLSQNQSTWGRYLGFKNQVIKGVYLWGGIGRGKTWLMDSLYQSLPTKHKKRVHFYAFMQGIHQDIKALSGKKNPLHIVAKKLAKHTRLLCLDEFLVHDISDAIILGQLLNTLFAEGITLVITSNIPPKLLYEDGLQRDHFLATISLIEQHTHVLDCGQGQDFRQLAFSAPDNSSQKYFYPANQHSHLLLQDNFELLTHYRHPQHNALNVNGRLLDTVAWQGAVIWLEFSVLCAQARAAADYLALARCIHTLLIEHVPMMDAGTEDIARRFITLIDILYDHHVTLFLSAELPLEQLYQGEKLDFEFKRTLSRLKEMQSQSYFNAAVRD